MAAKTLITFEEFDRLEEEEFRYELDEGELITTGAGDEASSQRLAPAQ